MTEATILLANAASAVLRAPDPGVFDIKTTAHSLAQINRFTGHARRPYSVAEHSLLVSLIIEREGGCVLAQMAGLMHDAHEQIVGDATSPMKTEMRRIAAARTFEASYHNGARAWSDYDRIESAAAQAIRSAFGLKKIFSLFDAQVGRADMVALATERRDLMPQSAEVWACLDGIEALPLDVVDLMASERIAASWADWRDGFIDRYHDLQEQISHTSIKGQLAPTERAA